MSSHLLIIEDDPALNQILTLHFEDQGHQVSSVGLCAEALEILQQHSPDLALLDQQLPDGLGSDLLPKLIEACPGLPVIMMTGQHDLELAIQAIKNGAADFIHKPVETRVLQASVDQILRQKKTPAPAAHLHREETSSSGLIGRSNAMLKVSKDIGLCAGNSATVLISGESGTGKELVAELIHRYSGRHGPFIAVNCAAIVDTLLESELFGHEKGAFTGATSRKPGRFELANEGTLFLDEIAELAPTLQAKLLRVLQERSFELVGGTQTMTTNARIIAATHKDVFAEAETGAFRDDLAYRLSVINIQLPALRERQEDIPLLVSALLERSARNIGVDNPSINKAAIKLLATYPWPGNVRELENVLTQALVQARGAEIDTRHLHFRTDASTSDTRISPPGPLLSLEQVEAAHIQRVLDHTQGHKGHSCEILGISRPALDRKIKKYQLILTH